MLTNMFLLKMASQKPLTNAQQMFQFFYTIVKVKGGKETECVFYSLFDLVGESILSRRVYLNIV